MLRVVVAGEGAAPTKSVLSKDRDDVEYPWLRIRDLFPVGVIGEGSEVDGNSVTVFADAVGNPVPGDGILASTSIEGLELGNETTEVGLDHLGQSSLESRDGFPVDINLTKVVVPACSNFFGQGEFDQRYPGAHDLLGRTHRVTRADAFPGGSFSTIIFKNPPGLPHQDQKNARQ